MKSFFLCILTALFIFSSCNSSKIQTPEILVDELITILKNNDQKAFEELLPEKSDMESLMKATTKYDQKVLNERWATMQNEKDNLYKRFTRKNINWENAVVDSLVYKIDEQKNIKGSKVMVHFTTENGACKMELRRVMKVGSGGWKIMNFPSFYGCNSN